MSHRIIGSLLEVVRYGSESIQDMYYSLRYNTYSPFEDRNRRIFYRMIILTHALEKGLSLQNPRQLFGIKKIRALMQMIRDYDPVFSCFPLEMARGAFIEYVEFHRAQHVQDAFLEELEAFLNEPRYFNEIDSSGGIVKHLSVGKETFKDPLVFMRSRFSCRSFRPEKVPDSLVEKIVNDALVTPSQCNRQSVRIHCYTNRNLIEELLITQGGAAGMHEGIFNLFIVTTETTAWGGAGQRNQGYIDGGLMSYGLMLTAHAHALNSCALNLAVSNAKERKIKSMGSIHARERLVMMIAFGYPLEDEVTAARSPRLSGSFILTHHR